MKPEKIIALVQARLASRRFPRKIARTYLGFPMLWHLCERLQRVPSLHSVVVICPPPNVLYIRSLVPKGVRVLGPLTYEKDLVRRHVLAADYLRATTIVRVPGDNPCVDPAYVEEAIQTYHAHPFVYYSNTTAECQGTFVDGIGAEVVSYNRLRWLDAITKGDDDLREHPHLYFVRQGLLQLPEATVRLDVNTERDEDRVRPLFEHFGHNRFTTQEALDALRNRTEEI